MKRTAMSGYGVELALKRTDYLVVDDRAKSSGRKDGSQSSDVASGAEATFSETLGPDPWSETATPMTNEEIAGEIDSQNCDFHNS